MCPASVPIKIILRPGCGRAVVKISQRSCCPRATAHPMLMQYSAAHAAASTREASASEDSTELRSGSTELREGSTELREEGHASARNAAGYPSAANVSRASSHASTDASSARADASRAAGEAAAADPSGEKNTAASSPSPSSSSAASRRRSASPGARPPAQARSCSGSLSTPPVSQTEGTGIDSYQAGNDLRYIALRSSAVKEDPTKPLCVGGRGPSLLFRR